MALIPTHHMFYFPNTLKTDFNSQLFCWLSLRRYQGNMTALELVQPKAFNCLAVNEKRRGRLDSTHIGISKHSPSKVAASGSELGWFDYSPGAAARRIIM